MTSKIASIVRCYSVLLIALIAAYLWLHGGAIASIFQHENWLALCLVALFYLVSHMCRMLRLSLLSLDERSKVPALVGAHVMTAFPGNVLPLKIGELLRLGSFFLVYDGRQKALAIWLTERFFDILVITAFMFCLYMIRVSVPETVRLIFFLFAAVSILGLAGIFATSRVFIYLNRHLVLTSTTNRGLMLLKASHKLRELEGQIKSSIEGRLSGVLLLTFFIWAMEVVTLFYFLSKFSQSTCNWKDLLVNGLLGSLPGGDSFFTEFGVYRVVALVALLVLSAVAILVRKRFGRYRV